MSEFDLVKRCVPCHGTGDANAPDPRSRAGRTARGLRQVTCWFGPEDMEILDAGAEVFGSYAETIRVMLRDWKGR